MENNSIKYFMSNDTVFKIFFRKEIILLKRLIGMSLKIKEQEVTNVIFKDSTVSTKFKQVKKGVLDLLVQINNSKLVNVELQNSDNKNTTERFTWYLCSKYIDNLKEGEDYSELDEVYGIYLLNYNDKNYPNFYSYYKSCDIMNVKTTAKSMINMSIFNLKKIEEIEKYEFSEEQEDLLRFIMSEDEEELEEMAKKSMDLKRALKLLREINADEELRHQILLEQRREHDEAQARSDRDEAIKEMHVALEQRDRVINERDSAINERDKAIEERNNSTINIAKNLLSLKIKPEDISKATGLSTKAIANLR